MAGETLKPFDGQLDTPPHNLTPFSGELDAPDAKRTVLGTAKDVGVTALKGAVGLPQSVVGLAGIVTGGRAGKALEQAGVGFEETQKFLDDQYSDAQKAANRKVQAADGFVDTAKTMLENPSTIATSVGESIPQMLGGAGVARGLLKLAPKVAPAIAGAIGEGVLGAGSQAEQIRQETQDGLLTPKQAALSAATGAATAGFGALGGRLAQRLGIGDADTMLAQGAIHGAGPASQRSLARQVGAGMLSEGVLEELPQSMSEQALQNLALDKPVGEGVGKAAAAGLLAGGAMGGGAALLHGATGQHAPNPAEPGGAERVPGEQLSLLPATEAPSTAVASELPAVAGGLASVQRTFDPRDPASRPPLDVMPTAPTDGVDFEAPAPGAREFSTGNLALADEAKSVRPSEAMGLDPAAGPLSTAAALAVDGGAHDVMNAAAQLAAQAEAADGKGTKQAAASPAPAAAPVAKVNAETGEISEQPQDREAELRARLEFVRQQAASNGWDQRLIAERDSARAELAAFAPAAPTAPNSVQEGIAQARDRRAPPESAPQPKGETLGTQADQAQQAVAQQASAGAEATAAAPVATAAALTPTPAAPAVPNAKREKAIRRVEEGRAWFLSRDKAQSFVDTSGIADTHEVVADNRRFIVQAKDAQPAQAAQPQAAAPADQLADLRRRRAEAVPGTPLRRDIDNDIAQIEREQGSAARRPEAAAPVDAAANEAATSPQNDLPEPSQAQKEAGNYKMGHLSGDEVQGLRISVENPQGSTRRGTSPNGTEWSNTMAAHYGYVKGSEAADGDHVDVFVGPDAASAPTVYVVDQINADGTYDEAKALFGFNSEAEAVAAYKGSYDADWKVGPVTAMSVDDFKAGLASGRFKKPLSPTLTRGAAAAPRATTMETARTAVASYFDWYLGRNPRASRPMGGIYQGNTFTLDAGGAPFTKDGQVQVNGFKHLTFNYTAAWKEAQSRARASAAGPIAASTPGDENGRNAGAVQTERLPAADQGGDARDAGAGDRDRQPVDARVAEAGESADRGERVSAGAEGAGGGRAQGVQRSGEPAPSAPRDSGDVRSERQPADAVADPATAQASPKPELDQPSDHTLDAEDIGKGGLTKKYRDNIAAIRILKALAGESRKATPEERKQIARYVGWGALKGVFDPQNKQWAKEFAELRELLTDAEYKAARASMLNAHYTSPVVVDGIYQALERMGFSAGRVLEPAVGTGNFFGLMPASMRKRSQLHGVELDPITSQIAAALYPSAKVAQATGFQDFQAPAEYFDLAVGNPPFGSEPIVDDDRSPYSGFSIHNYFFAKSIDKLRPGGLLAMVVSHNFLDAKNEATRQWIADRANLVAAVRLPNTAFKANAGTDVVTDIVVFQKKTESERANGLGDAAWVKVGQQTLANPKTGEATQHNVSSYFLSNPDAVLGRPTAAGSMYRVGEYTVEPSGDLAQQLKTWADALPEDLYQPVERTHEQEAADVVVPDGVKVGSFYVDDSGRVLMRGPDSLGNRTAEPWTPPNVKAAERMKGMVGLRDALRAQMRLERSPDSTDGQIEQHRRELNRLYDGFQSKYGYLNDPTNRRIFLDDTESALVLALEFDYDRGVSKAVAEREDIEPRAPKAVKADIFARRVMFPPADNIKVSNAKDALLASLNYKGRLDADYMATLYDKPPAQIVSELGDVVYADPVNGLVMAHEYLSGDVKTKLAEAEAAARDDPALRRNVEALRKVIPADKRPSEIHAAMGAAFIPQELFQQFAKEVTGADARVTYLRATGQWLVDYTSQPNPALNTAKWGISRMTAQNIFMRTMAGQGVVVTDTIRDPNGGTRTVVLEKETEAAREKQTAMKAEWQRWLWSDPERADRVAGIYNDKMNRIVVRRFDGSHMTFPGMSPAMELLPHQKDAVWRALQQRQILLDHVVGAGKTFEVVAAIMEMRRLGIARKPIVTVPNHLTLQWRSEFSRLYPAANVLAATPDDFTKGNREKFFSKIVTGDWDAVIIGHSSLKRIALPAETEKAVLEEQITELADSIGEMKRARGDRNIVRDMESIKARLEARMKQRVQALGERDKVVTFDELGVDAFAIDELHEFKNLFYNSTMERVPGMGNPGGSDKAFDLFVKAQYLFDALGDKAPLMGATGTPVSNSLVEMFNMQRFLQYPTLKAQGLHVFDAWAKQFGSVESLYEVSPSGTGYRQASRFAKFKNLPALMGMYQTFADTVTLDDLKAQEEARGRTFPVPQVAGGRPVNVVAKRSPEVANFMGVPQLDIQGGRVQFGFNPAAGERAVVEKAEDGNSWRAETRVPQPDEKEIRQLIGSAKTEEDARLLVVEAALSPKIKVDPKSILGQFADLKRLTKETKGKVNALSLTGQANKAGLDFRLIDPTASDFAGSKINLAVDRMLGTYQKWAADRGTQLVFCDLSVPLSARSGFGSKERRVYVREDGALAHKKGTMHTVRGHEDLPFFVVKEGGKDAKAFTIYDAATGLRVHAGLPAKGIATDWAAQALNDDSRRQRWIDARDRIGDLQQDEIDDYNNANEIDTEETESISLSDIAGMSGATAFSVYDDIKGKLVARGVPEREIAFIHDYNTPAAKDKLFKAVNRGDIRFLLGSTPKMGAGTNVQERLVGLHHIDAPWRPSDLEQREGRIIRRGNALYARDPDGFEVEIYRYATEQTYDTRRWQILEHKARGIEQLRKYDGTLNEIDDIEGEAANAADMKAAASGDPLILEETRLRNDVRRLESLQASHADETAAMVRQARDQQRFAEDWGPKELDTFRALQTAAEANPVPKDGFAGLTVAGKTITDREAAIKAVKRGIDRVFVSGGQEEFQYRGVTFMLEGTPDHVELNSPTGGLDSYRPARDVLPSAAGILTRFGNYVNRLPAHIADLEAKIAGAKQSAVQLREQAGKPFAQATELEAAREAHRRVQRRLVAKGPDIPLNQRPALQKAMAEQRQQLTEQGFGDALEEFGGPTDDAQFRRDGTEMLSPEAARAMRALLPNYSPEARAQAVASVSKTVEAIRAGWGNGPEVIVAFDMGDPVVPEAARRADLKQRSGGARGAPEGFYYRGKAYLMASRLPTANDAARVLFHEVLGHHGLRGQFGKGLDDVLNQIGTMRRADVDAKIEEYGLRGVNKLDRRAAAEEVLAEMAQTHPELHFVRRAIAAIRTWLRQHVPGFSNLRMTDDEIVRNFILPARRFVEQGGPDGGPGDGLRFSRGDAGPASTNSLDAPIATNDEGVANFWHWYSGQDGSLKDTRSGTQGSGGTAGGAAAGGPGRDGGAPGRLGPVDAQGRPLVFFHGTRDDFAAFDTEHPNRKDVGWLGRGVYGASDAADANYYAGAKRGQGGQRVMPLYFAVTNPYVATPEIKARLKRATQAQVDRFTSNLRAMGHDGVTLTAEDGSVEIVAFEPTQVKSAIGNSGAFDGGNPDIRFSRSTVQDFAKKATAELNKTFNAPGKLSWWHKTVGTMYNLAERSPAFKAVFDSAQGFVDDVSFYANDAAELAPKLLPKLETWRDIKKAPVAAADNAAVAKPVFEGTLTWARDEQGKPVPVQSLIDAAAELTADQKAQRLLRNGQIDERMLKAWQGMPLESYEKAINTRFESRMLQPGVVWTDAELRSMFKLSDDQIALYHEFRETTDRSLDTMARADMLRFVGDDAKVMRGMVMDAPDAQAAAVLLRDHLVQLANEQPDRATQILNTANGIIDRADKVRDLQARGYAPLSRFGRYSVDVVDAAGERQYFGLFETAREANNMATKMREEFGDATVTQGTLSEEAFKLFAGVTPETLELFGNALGLDSTGDSAQDQAFQEYLRLTKTNRSAMRRLIHRKGIAGFSEDVGRVLASFIYSNARQTAAGLHMGDLGEAVQAIPKEQGELKDAAVRLADYVKNPQEEAQAVRGLLFAQYLGGSVASAFVNMTQPIAVTMPWLSQYGGARAAAAQIGRAAKNIATRGFEYEPDLAAALKRAEDEGTVSPQEVHQLMAQARGASSLRSGDGTRGGELRAMGQNALSRLSLAWGKLFGAAEQVNRRITFVAAYRTAKAQGIEDPAGFARKAITETQFLYSKANKMEWGRGAMGGTLMTFKTYSVAYLELLHRMYTQGGPEGKRAALLALGMLMLMGGAGGLPFEEDLEDAVDALAQMLGYNFSTKKARQEFLESLLPKPIAQFVDKGVSGLPGAPLDVSGRLGMGNLIPGTGLLLEKTSHARDLLEIAGPAGDFVSRILSGGRSVLTGDVGAGLLEMSPAAVRNAAKGADMAATGMYRDAKGYKVLDTNTLEAALKTIGFQPNSVATIQEANGINQGAKAFYNLRAQEIRATWAQGIFEGDQQKVQDARDQVAAWNRKNLEQPMLVRIPDVMRRVREMRKSKDERIADTAPRAMRAQMREDLARTRADL
ncbi:N12 class adenine-specific DNA methylase [Variovorax sp. SG517]|uniref:PLxRFG domain-containing protein n=1 Tax=Variovorax sp. SG517 TaxID=2587117 RepID=UPI0018404BB2|nr:PLxRFG domain-containing protein [Variovorax sp. SG517]NVM91063.1 N12 class adenine-specific DNA methylase [Variovorax sp. SG517]